MFGLSEGMTNGDKVSGCFFGDFVQLQLMLMLVLFGVYPLLGMHLPYNFIDLFYSLAHFPPYTQKSQFRLRGKCNMYLNLLNLHNKLSDLFFILFENEQTGEQEEEANDQQYLL